MLQTNEFRRQSRTMLVLLTWCLMLPALAATPSSPQPNPSLSPTDVVRIQLTAMRHNDEPTPDAGIATVYAFAAPGNRQLTGSLSQFTRMIHSGYAPMIGNLKFILGKSKAEQGVIFQQVTLIAADGRSYKYVFVLSRQKDPPYHNCWMTNSVLPQDNGQGEGTAL